MNQVAFIVKLNLDGGEPKNDVADDLHELIASDGYQVISVMPWASPGEAQEQASMLGLLTQNLSAPRVGGTVQDDGTVTAN